MFLPYLEEITYLDKPNRHNLNFFRKTYLMDFFELGLVFDENGDLIGIKKWRCHIRLFTITFQ